MDLQKLNLVANNLKQRTLKRIPELSLQSDYSIENIKKVKTKFGDKVIVELEQDVYCYLPSRVSTQLLSNGEQGLNEFKEQLTVSTIKMRRLDGSWNPVEFIMSDLLENAPAND